MPALPARVARPRSRALLAVIALLSSAAPAAAQFYDRPYGRPYVQPYIDMDLNAYNQPGPADYNAPPVGLPPQDVEPMLRSMGMRNVGRVRAGGNIYAVDATDPRGMRQRVRIDAMSGRIISMIPLGPDTGATRYGATPPGNGNWNPPPAVMNVPSGVGAPVALPAEPPLPPIRQPEFAAVPPADEPPADAPPAGASPAASPPLGSAAESPAPPATAGPADPAVAGPAKVDAAKSETLDAGAAPAAANGPIRVIPGVAVPPGTEPTSMAPAQAGVGTGMGTGTGEAAGSAGTASVVARDSGSTTPAP
ncbi:hypothetical protein [Ancylobacter radicis]|uniref:PepSY domain-containing protein n=1 Tax=Ancylobacter radicis TaxID=2836179 RepID=A0ABS5R9D1_9HYPH|nr:hypothetical protein [Ancylobacter radicis]MBS9478284.1 hypothetical protein [Ancylobacter radicis]